MADTYYIRKVKIEGLFGRGDEISLDFQEGVNCIYGANGSGKTTIINLLVAGLSCDIDKFLASRCDNLTVYVAKTGQKRPILFFNVKKTRNEKNQLDGLSYDFADNFYDKNLNSDAPSGQTRKMIRETLKFNYLPLYRYNESELDEHVKIEDRYTRNVNKNWRLDPPDENSADPLRRMLGVLERKFKDEYSGKQREIRENLELLKNKVLEKLLIDDVLVSKAKESKIKKNEIKSDDYKKAQQKLDEIGLRLPGDKLEKHFAAMMKASQDVSAKIEEVRLLQENPQRDQDKLYELFTEHSTLLKIYRTLDTVHNRFLSILSDVEKSTEYRVNALKDFKKFEDLLKDFFINKEFEFSESGQFKFQCRGHTVGIDDLSSGEKHIMALLGKVALSSSDRDVFIADEPELSLHLAWQRKLLPALRKLAPGMQIIVATHAPAIIPSTAAKIDLDEINHDSASV